MTCQVFKTTCVDGGKPLWEGAFFFTRRTLFSPLDKKDTRDRVKGLRLTSERYIGELGVPGVLLIGGLRIARMVSRRGAEALQGATKLTQ